MHRLRNPIQLTCITKGLSSWVYREKLIGAILAMNIDQKVNILMVDDQPSKLLSYEVVLSVLGENLIKAGSATEALEQLLRNDIAVVLMDVNMPDMDGFELAEMMRQHPRFQKTAIIFISGIHLSNSDRLKGYERGAVDYISVPFVPEVLRAKVSVFTELYRKTRQLEELNRVLEERVEERTGNCESALIYLSWHPRPSWCEILTADFSIGTPVLRLSTDGSARRLSGATSTRCFRQSLAHPILKSKLR